MDLSQWRGCTALVTGASSGIGEATARRLAAAGLRVVVTARRTARLAQLCEELNAAGGEAHALALDISDGQQVDEVFAHVAGAWGGVDVLIANAGLGHYGQVAVVPREHWQEMRAVNLDGFMHCIQAALPQLKAKPKAQIVVMSSLNAHRVILGVPNVFYSATKAAMASLVEGLRMELAREKSRIKLGMISPGLVSTEFQHKAAKLDEGEAFDYRLNALSPDDIADMACYLLSTPPNVQIHDMIVRPIAQQN